MRGEHTVNGVELIFALSIYNNRQGGVFTGFGIFGFDACRIKVRCDFPDGTADDFRPKSGVVSPSP